MRRLAFVEVGIQSQVRSFTHFVSCQFFVDIYRVTTLPIDLDRLQREFLLDVR
jgi:hypothetical protein